MILLHDHLALVLSLVMQYAHLVLSNLDLTLVCCHVDGDAVVSADCMAMEYFHALR